MSTSLLRRPGPVMLTALLALAQVLGGSGCGVGAPETPVPNTDSRIDRLDQLEATTVPELRAQLTNIAQQVQELKDEAALRGIMDCYGQGHDTIFFHLGTGQSEALKLLKECFADDVKSDIYLFDGKTPAASLTTLEQLVGFIETNAMNSNYRSARNTPGDVRVQRTGANSARILSSTSAPHYLRAMTYPAPQAAIDLITARYANEVVKDADGKWRTHSFTLILDELWRGSGSYPMARQ